MVGLEPPPQPVLKRTNAERKMPAVRLALGQNIHFESSVFPQTTVLDGAGGSGVVSASGRHGPPTWDSWDGYRAHSIARRRQNSEYEGTPTRRKAGREYRRDKPGPSARFLIIIKVSYSNERLLLHPRVISPSWADKELLRNRLPWQTA